MSSNLEKKIAFITGANRGIGYEISKSLGKRNDMVVILGCRSPQYAEEALLQLTKQVPEGSFDICLIDVSDETSITNAVNQIFQKYQHIDIIINNAGILNNPNSTIMDVNIPETLEHIKINALAPMKLIQLILPVMLKRNFGRIVNISSISGSIGNLVGAGRYRDSPEADYKISKATFNIITALFEDYIRPNGLRPDSKDQPRPNILINAVCPGWAKTRMGGPTAEISPEEAALVPVYLATLPDDGPTGKFIRYKEEIPW